MYVIRQKKSGLFLAGTYVHRWTTLENARVFARLGDVKNFLRRNDTDYYLTDGSNVATKGICVVDDGLFRN